MTKSTETEIAVLQTQMADVKASLEVIKTEQHTNFQALAVKIDNLSNTPLEIDTIRSDIRALQKAKEKAWVWQTLSAAAGAVLAILIAALVTRK